MAQRASLIQRRWKEVVRDLSDQHGIDTIALLGKMPAFAVNDPASSNSGKLISDFTSISKAERRVLKAAADTMAEVIFAIVSPANRYS